jgi:hypothetical protein
MMQSVKTVRATHVTMFFIVGVMAEPMFARPVLVRTDKVTCTLSIDGGNIGDINMNGDAYFLRVDIGPGQHIAQCTSRMGPFDIGESQPAYVPFSISATLTIPEGTEQMIIDLPRPVMRLDDFARALGSHGFYAYVDQTYPFYGVVDTDCSQNPFAYNVDNAQGRVQKAQNDISSALNDTSSMNEVCSAAPNSGNCRGAKSDYKESVQNAQDKKDKTESDLSAARRAQSQFFNRLQTATVAVFPNSRKVCGAANYVTIQLDKQNYLAAPAFRITSGLGATFYVK